MAERDASLAVENAEEKLVQATRLLLKVNKLKELRKSLSKISKIVKEYDGQEYDPDVAEWLRKVEKVADESQELLGTMVADTNLKNQRGKFRRLLSGGRETNHHEEKIEHIADQMESFAGSLKDHPHNGSINFEIGQVVGFQDQRDTLVKDLLKKGRPQRDVVLISGKAGSGKTTLAKMIYKTELNNENFDFQKWIYIPRELTLEALLWRILKHIDTTCNETDFALDKVGLKAKLSESLKGKRYFIVLDSIYNTETWDELLTSFPDELNGSWMLMTSRLNPTGSAVIILRRINPLDVKQSWELLLRKVFQGEDCPSGLENIGKELVEKCKGSPRAVMALATILYNAEKTEDMWSKFLMESHQGKPILDLASYNDLEERLQQCFLYLGLFPETSDIPAKQIIQMWIAEGLLKKRDRKSEEEIGREYLQKLITESFIQEGMRGTDEQVKNCRILSHVSKICVSEGKGFIEVHNNNMRPQNDSGNRNSSHQTHSETQATKLAIHSDSQKDVLKRLGKHSPIRSLHCFGKFSTSICSNDISGILEKHSTHLTVLNLGSLQLDRVPKALGKLKIITYLRLCIPKATYLPSFIGNLQHLQTLDMRESSQVKVSNAIWKIKSLRHLYLGEFTIPDTRGMQYYKSLPNLQTLRGVHSDKVLKWLMVRAKFPNVKILRICSLKPDVTYSFLTSLDHLYHLECLRVERPTKLPDTAAFPLSLKKLTLLGTELEENCIETLEKLPNLRVLKLLENAILGQEFRCSAEGFLQLEVLRMKNLDLKWWTIRQGAMQCLKRLCIKDCCELIIPDQLSHIALIDKDDATQCQAQESHYQDEGSAF